MSNRLPSPPQYGPPGRAASSRKKRLLSANLADNILFALSLGCVVLLAAALARQGARWSPAILYLLGFWLVLTYLALPRLNRILTAIYVPDYFIGRTHTTDGLLGDPVNIAVRGTEAQLRRAMEAAGWARAEPVTAGSAWRMVSSFLLGRSYPTAPVSTLMLFGKPQAIAYQQEVSGSVSKRHHVRFWPAPEGWLLPGGDRVDWLGAGSYDRAVGLSLFTLQFTHRIDADIDVERDYILDSVAYALPDVKISVLEHFSTGYHSRNGGGDAIVTDGHLPILELGTVEAPESSLVPRRHSDQGVAARPPALIIGIVTLAAAFAFDLVSYVPRLIQGVADQVQHLSPGQVERAVTGVVALHVLAYGAIIGLVWLTFLGHGWARHVLLAVFLLQVVGQLVVWVRTPEGLPMVALMATSAYVLALFSLSSLSVRSWTRKRTKHRRALKAKARQAVASAAASGTGA